MTANTRAFRMLTLAACAAVLLGGCLRARPMIPTPYYILEPPIAVEAQPAGNRTLGVRPLLPALPIERRIAYRDGAFLVGYRPEEWAERPADTVTRALMDALLATERFSDVGNAAEMSRPQLILTGELRRFYENRAASPVTAEIEVRLELREPLEDGAVWAETLRVEQALEGEDARALAAAMSSALGQLASQAAKAIAGAV